MELDNVDKPAEAEENEMTPFEVIVLKLLGHMTLEDHIDEEVIDLLRESQLEYYSLLKKYEILEERVNIDEKTMLLKYNESFLINIVKAISRYWESSQKNYNLPISYLRMDLDDFSKINNRYGHDAGDKILIEVAGVMKRLSRPTDYLFRFGGEEFDIVLPVTELVGAKIYVEKILNGIRQIEVVSSTGETVTVTASVGMSSFILNLQENPRILAENILQLYHVVQKQADYACYHAKLLGKDQYSVFSENVDYEKIMKAYSGRV